MVETEMIQESPSVKVQTPHAVDVKRETGLIALKTAEEFGLTVETQDELQKVDVEDFVRAMKNVDAATVSTAYRFLKPEFGLTVKVEPVQPQIDAVVRDSVRVGTEQIALRTTIEYTIKRGGVFSLRLALPVDYRVEHVAGDHVSQSVEKPPVTAGEPRLLDVTLKERTIGEYTLTVDLVRALPQLPPTIEVAGVRPLDTQKLSGSVLVSSEEGVQLKSGSFDGLTEIPPDQIGWQDTRDVNEIAPSSGATALAYKFIPSGSAGTEPGWKLTLATEKIESWVRAEIVNTVSLTETLVSGKSLVRFEIQNAPTKEFRLRVPAAYRNVEITGSDIRRKDKDDATGEWRIELQNRVRGYYTLTVTWEQPWNVKDGSFELAGLKAAGVERETGILSIIAPARLKVDPKLVTPDLLKVDERDRPDWAGSTSEPAVLAYRYLRPGYKLTLAAQQFQEAEVLQALADSMRLTTVISEDGQMMTDMALAVRNNGRQYLEVTLPEDAVVWSAFVAGQPVRPSQRGGKLLLPMERSAGDATVPVDLTYVGAGPFPRRSGSLRMMSPALDVPLKNARWELYLPPDYQYGDFQGTMKQEIQSAGAGAARAVASFGVSEYQRAETDKKAAANAEAVSSLSNARSQLAGGKVSDAFQFFNRAKQAVALDDRRGNEDLRKLEGDLRREQGRSLMQAQQSFVAGNSYGRQDASEAESRSLGGGVSTEQMQFEEQAAEQQATKVQQAQEVTAAKTLSLRVNLPKRGIHYTFSQVLQTEVGKPMSVQFRAVNDRAMSWPSRIVTSVGLFAILWLMVALTLRWKGTSYSI